LQKKGKWREVVICGEKLWLFAARPPQNFRDHYLVKTINMVPKAGLCSETIQTIDIAPLSRITANPMMS